MCSEGIEYWIVMARWRVGNKAFYSHWRDVLWRKSFGIDMDSSNEARRLRNQDFLIRVFLAVYVAFPLCPSKWYRVIQCPAWHISLIVNRTFKSSLTVFFHKCDHRRRR